jgi:hypothetical protein
MHFQKYILIYTIVPLFVITVTASYYRFMVANDYMVSYEGDCDPYTEQCYIGCEDDECTEEYFYTIIQKHAVDLLNTCGDDINDCDDAYTCLESDRECSITYCDFENNANVCETMNNT